MGDPVTLEDLELALALALPLLPRFGLRGSSCELEGAGGIMLPMPPRLPMLPMPPRPPIPPMLPPLEERRWRRSALEDFGEDLRREGDLRRDWGGGRGGRGRKGRGGSGANGWGQGRQEGQQEDSRVGQGAGGSMVGQGKAAG